MFILGNNVRLMLVTHSCFREECRLTCPLDGAKFAQEARESSADMKCDMNAEQQYSFGRCNMKCLSSVMPGVCRQVRNFGICEFMTFNATQSIQISPVVFMPNITTNHAITYTNQLLILHLNFVYYSTVYSSDDVCQNTRNVKLKFSFFAEMRVSYYAWDFSQSETEK